MRISVCIPMYNENRIIETTAQRLSSYMEAHFDDYEILFCNDGSTDGCDETVRALNLPRVRVIGYSQNRGKGHAVRTAMLEATGDVRIFTDSDLAYGTDVIESIVKAFEQNPNAELVIGSRNLHKDGYEGYTWLRRMASKLYIRIVCATSGLKLSDSQCGCKAFSAKAAESIFPRCEIDGFAFDLEAILWARMLEYHYVEIPVRVINHGDSKVRVTRDTWKMLCDLQKMKKRIRAESLRK